MIAQEIRVTSRGAMVQAPVQYQTSFIEPTKVQDMSRFSVPVFNPIQTRQTSSKEEDHLPLAEIYSEPGWIEQCVMKLPVINRIIGQMRTGEIIRNNQQSAIDELTTLLDKMQQKEDILISKQAEKGAAFHDLKEYMISVYQDGVYDNNNEFICSRDGRITPASLSITAHQLETISDALMDIEIDLKVAKKNRNETRRAIRLMKQTPNQYAYIEIMTKYKRKMGFSDAEISRYVDSVADAQEDTVQFFEELKNSGTRPNMNVEEEADDDEESENPRGSMKTIMQQCREAADLRRSMPTIQSLPIAVNRVTEDKSSKKPPPPPPSFDAWIEAPTTVPEIRVPVSLESEQEADLAVL